MSEGEMTLAKFQEINAIRSAEWHDGKREWTPVDWSNACAGEVGELCNLAKKLQRARDGIISKHFDPETDSLEDFEDDMRAKMADEIADVVIYAALNASMLGLDFDFIVRKKFNEDSKVLGFTQEL
jgi:NTP pyrophosphatase (non-canonical NTP hydrolase)